MIVTEDLSKQFDELLAIDSLNLHVQAGEVLALLGPNGAGKTTTVRLLTSVLKPTRGRASVAGYDVVEQAAQVRASVGVLTEQHGLYVRMRGEEYLHFFGQLYGLDRISRNKCIGKLLDEFGLTALAQQRISTYSKGMRQKFALARALLHNPPVLLLDEPTSAMDPESAHLVRDSIQQMRSDARAIVICTHNLAEAEELADKIAIIQHGRIIMNGNPDWLKRQLFGPPEYQITLSSSLNSQLPELPRGVIPSAIGSTWLRYCTDYPEEVNPLVLQVFHKAGLPVVSLQEVPRSLEQVYLQAVRDTEYKGGNNVG